jgi:hypothetical protein
MIADAFSPDDVIAMIGAGRIKDVPTIAAPGHLRLLGRLQTARLTRSLAQADKCLLCGTKPSFTRNRPTGAFGPKPPSATVIVAAMQLPRSGR